MDFATQLFWAKTENSLVFVMKPLPQATTTIP